MDLWFPADPILLHRSQEHTRLLLGYAGEWRWFTTLAFVIKTFMQQHLLNSGYSGLGSYGVLLMIVRYLQVEREAGREGEANVGRLLCGFFRFWAEFDYVSLAVDVKGEGRCVEKTPAMVGSSGPNPQVQGRSEQDRGGEGDEAAEEEAVGEEEEADAAGDDPTPFRLRRRCRHPTPGDRLTLIITDPCDVTNFILCHQKALRNMVHAFIHACHTLDPSSPPTHPAKEVQTIALFAEAELRPLRVHLLSPPLLLILLPQLLRCGECHRLHRQHRAQHPHHVPPHLHAPHPPPPPPAPPPPSALPPPLPFSHHPHPPHPAPASIVSSTSTRRASAPP